MTGVPLIFGEVLFDHFEDGSRVLGGAPFNVAWNLQALGAEPLFVSRVGDDPEGRQVRDRMLRWGMTAAGLQLDPAHPTGSVAVTIRDSEPTYEIVPDRSWDFIDGDCVPAGAPALIYHGSLALRCPTSAAAFEALAALHPVPIFVDVNLRPPWWHIDTVRQMLDRATYAKLNEDEVKLLRGADGGLSEGAQTLLERHRLELLIVTRGHHGAFALQHDGGGARIAPAQDTKVVDTVGAGDSFTSVVILGLLNHWPIGTTLERAQALASALVGTRGATVDDPAFYAPFRDRNQP